MQGLRCCSGFSLVAASRGCSLAAVHGLLIVVASLVGEYGLLVSRASVIVGHGLSCMWDLPGLGMEPTSPLSPTLSSGFFTTEPPGILQ